MFVRLVVGHDGQHHQRLVGLFAELGDVWDLAAILSERDQPVRLLRSTRPGRIVWEDEHQVVVEERRLAWSPSPIRPRDGPDRPPEPGRGRSADTGTMRAGAGDPGHAHPLAWARARRLGATTWRRPPAVGRPFADTFLREDAT